jgi:hypothetical protein
MGPAFTGVLAASSKLSIVAKGRKARFLIVGKFLLVSFRMDAEAGKISITGLVLVTGSPEKIVLGPFRLFSFGRNAVGLPLRDRTTQLMT